jgi:hypothetical protein
METCSQNLTGAIVNGGCGRGIGRVRAHRSDVDIECLASEARGSGADGLSGMCRWA